MIAFSYGGTGSKVVVEARGKVLTLDCSMEQFEGGLEAYKAGAKIQDALPFLTADQREFLLSGMLPDEFAAFCQLVEGDYTEE